MYPRFAVPSAWGRVSRVSVFFGEGRGSHQCRDCDHWRTWTPFYPLRGMKSRRVQCRWRCWRLSYTRACRTLRSRRAGGMQGPTLPFRRDPGLRLVLVRITAAIRIGNLGINSLGLAFESVQPRHGASQRPCWAAYPTPYTRRSLVQEACPLQISDAPISHPFPCGTPGPGFSPPSLVSHADNPAYANLGHFSLNRLAYYNESPLTPVGVLINVCKGPRFTTIAFCISPRRFPYMTSPTPACISSTCPKTSILRFQ